MSIQIQSQNASPGTKVIFPFDYPVVSYLVGISYWKLKYDSSDHQTKQIALSVTTSNDKSNVYAIPNAILSGQGHNLDPDTSTFHLVCIAVLNDGGDNSGDVLAMVSGIPNGGQSEPINTPSPAYIDAAVLNGWNLEYGSGHHVKTFSTGVTPAMTGSATTIKGTAVMKDNTGNSASNPTVDGGLVATSSSSSLVSSTFQNIQTTSPQTVDFKGVSGLSSVGVMLQQLTVSYGSNTDHDIKSIGGGTSGWTVNGTQVTLDDAYAFMSDNSGHHQDASLSSVSLIVFGIPT